MDRQEKRLDIALEAIKQQITLATAIIGVAFAFSDQLTGARQGRIWAMLPLAFGPLALSIIAGVLALMAIAYNLGRPDDPLRPRGVRILGVVQNCAFLLAVVVMVWIVSSA